MILPRAAFERFFEQLNRRYRHHFPPGQQNRLWELMIYERLPFKLSHDSPISLHLPYDRFSGVVYAIPWGNVSSFVLACYRDGTILWLDDHFGDSDFAVFFERERLFDLLPDKLSEFMELLMWTKFSFMPTGKLAPDYGRMWWYSGQAGRGYEEHRHLAERIHPPALSGNANDDYQLRFHIWTAFFGKLFEVDCAIRRDSFEHTRIELADGVGDYGLPR